MFLAVSLKTIQRLLTIGLLCLLVVLCAAFYRQYPIRYVSTIIEAAEKNNLHPALVLGVVNTESRFNPKAKSKKGATGLMQLTETTANWMAEEMQLEGYDYLNIADPRLNVDIGCYYLRKLIDQYGSTDVALAAYNAGSGNVSGWLMSDEYSRDGKSLHRIPYGETRAYVSRVNKSAKVYKVYLALLKILKA